MGFVLACGVQRHVQPRGWGKKAGEPQQAEGGRLGQTGGAGAEPVERGASRSGTVLAGERTARGWLLLGLGGCVRAGAASPRHPGVLPALPTPVPSIPQKLAWEQQEPAERKLNFVPQQYRCLRAVPAYSRFIHERFERCLDLYLCPRQRKMRVRASPIPLPPTRVSWGCFKPASARSCVCPDATQLVRRL